MSDFEVPSRAQFEALSAQVATLGAGGGGGGGGSGMGKGGDAGNTVTLDASRVQLRAGVRTNRAMIQRQFDTVRVFTDRVEGVATVIGVSIDLVQFPPVAVSTTDAAGQFAGFIDLVKFPGRVRDMSSSVPSLNEFCTLELPFPLRLPANGSIELSFGQNVVDMSVYEERDDSTSNPVNGLTALLKAGVPVGGNVYLTAGGSGSATERAAGTLPAFGMRVVPSPSDPFTEFLPGSFEIVDDGTAAPYLRYRAFNGQMYAVGMMPNGQPGEEGGGLGGGGDGGGLAT